MIRFLKYLLTAAVLLVVITFLFMQQKSFGKLPTADRLKRIMKSSQYKNDRFHNISETPTLAEDASYVGMLIDFLGKGVDREPSKDLPVIKTDLKTNTSDKPVIVWFGHSSFLIKLNGKNILVDPIFSLRASPVQYAGSKSYPGTMAFQPEDFPHIDAIIISHDHYDHLDYNTIVAMKNTTDLFCVPLGVSEHLLHWGVAEEKIREFDWWDTQNIFADFQLTATPARHFSGRGFQRDKTLWASYALVTPSYKIYIGGDSGYDTHFKAIGEKFGRFDIAMLECGQYDKKWPFIHMMPEETVQASKDLNADVLLPVHWGKFTLALHPWSEPIRRALDQADKINVKIATPRIGEPLILGNTLPETRWWNN
jgi:L-ascorbate metabolism protein UlaG (beta-lactamase superfamily)